MLDPRLYGPTCLRADIRWDVLTDAVRIEPTPACWTIPGEETLTLEWGLVEGPIYVLRWEDDGSGEGTTERVVLEMPRRHLAEISEYTYHMPPTSRRRS